MSGAPRFETLVTGRGLIEGPRVDSEDRLYFSDARGHVLVGSLRSHAFSAQEPRETGELYRIDAEVTMLYDDVAMSRSGVHAT